MDSSVALEMVHADKEGELASRSAEDGVEYPLSQELISNSGLSPERENLSVENETSDSENSFFQDSSNCAPTSTKRIQRGKEQMLNSLSTQSSSSDSSSEYDYQPLSKKIAEYLKHPYRRVWKRKKRKKRWRIKTIKTSQKKTEIKRFSISIEERKRRLCDPGIQFPFIPSKRLTFKQYFTFEQCAVGGFLKQIQHLKYERTLKKSLKGAMVDEDSDDFDMRKYSYLDDDGPISPISEPGENLNEEEAEEEIEVVENSDFILSCQLPSKKKWRIKKT